MIVAISRFRVANELGDAVRQAFLSRPRLVDRVPGFLGMETYTSAADASVFHLVTRWTDPASFRTWHSSEAHHQSHAGIPRGLKLDAAFTELVVLDRIEGPQGPTPEEALGDTTRLLARQLSDSDVLHYVRAARDGTILDANVALARALGTSPTALRGGSLWERLTDPDAQSLIQLVEGVAPAGAERLMLNFLDAAQAPFTLLCHVDVRPDGLTVLGEPPRRAEQSLHEEMLGLNNELATLTRENARKSRALESALAELKQTQALLVHREKMASLGQMTAGVAHEINNPLAFVLSNQSTLRRDFDDLLGCLNGVSAALPEMELVAPDLHRRLTECVAAADLTYLAEAVPRKLQANLDGLERVRLLVLDLRTFSRLDEADVKECDLNDSLRSTLRFLDPLVKQHQVTLDTSYGDLSPVTCQPGALNQAVSNLVANAIQASAPGQRVRVTTEVQEADVVISVRDEGCGIAPENLQRVFDPFFTTKPVGAGTGLGLSIAHQVVAEHHGRIDVDSAPGRGTTVTIRIPLHGVDGGAD
jgi:two-component system, NtrC family, sensor kinase